MPSIICVLFATAVFPFPNLPTNSLWLAKKMPSSIIPPFANDPLNLGNFTLKVQNNGGLAPLKITGDVPESMTKVIVEPDNDKIREYLKDNECEWAHLEERGKHIVIK